MKVTDPKKTCNIGRGILCCIYLTCGPDGFECQKGTGSKIERTLKMRLEAGITDAKGTGQWKECLHNSVK